MNHCTLQFLSKNENIQCYFFSWYLSTGGEVEKKKGALCI